MDRDTVGLTDVLAGAQEGPNQERLIWLLWVGADNYVFVDTSQWGEFGFIYHEDVGAKRACCSELSIMPMSSFMVLVTGLNATWLQFFPDCGSDFREMLMDCELAACCARIARYLRRDPPGCWKSGKPISPGVLKNYPHGYPPLPAHQP